MKDLLKLKRKKYSYIGAFSSEYIALEMVRLANKGMLNNAPKFGRIIDLYNRHLKNLWPMYI